MTTLSPLSLLQAQGAQPAGGGWTFWVMIIAIFAIMYFFMIRPQNKKQKEIQKFRNALQPGQDVVTIGGIHGTIKTVDDTDHTVMLEVASGVKIKFEKSAIMPNAAAAQQR